MGCDAWTTVTINSLIDDGVIIVHKDGNHGSNYPKVEEFGLTGVPFLTAKLLDDRGNIDFASAPRLATEKAKKFTFGFLEAGDVLLSHNATVGRVAVVLDYGEKILIGTSLTHFRLNKSRLLPQYLAAYFSGRDFQNQLVAVMSQTTRNQVPISQQRKLTVVVPPMNEQVRIAAILTALDDRIGLLRETNATLEGIAQAIFKSWFVDFDPVKAKADGREPEGMDAETAALFPSEFEETELGMIPKGWRCGTLGELCTNRRDSIKPEEMDAGTPYIGLEHMPRKSISLAEWGMAEKVESGKSCFSKGDILFGKLRPYFHKVGPAPVAGVCSTDILVIQAKEPLWYGLSLSHLSSVALIDYADKLSNGAKMPRTNWNDLAKYQIVIPDSKAAFAFGSIVGTFVEDIRENILYFQTLASLRDTLLPRLMSGQLRVPDAEQQIAEAL